jgi:enoyl-CoA hydratase
LLLAADYRIGSLGNFKIGLNEVAIGLTMPAFGCEIARYTLTPQYFKRSLINAEIYTPEEALFSGFLDEVVDPKDLMKRALEKATELSALNMAAFKGTKRGARKDALDALRQSIEKDFNK